jgi:hypothetical protein
MVSVSLSAHRISRVTPAVSLGVDIDIDIDIGWGEFGPYVDAGAWQVVHVPVGGGTGLGAAVSDHHPTGTYGGGAGRNREGRQPGVGSQTEDHGVSQRGKPRSCRIVDVMEACRLRGIGDASESGTHSKAADDMRCGNDSTVSQIDSGGSVDRSDIGEIRLPDWGGVVGISRNGDHTLRCLNQDSGAET